MNLFVSAINAFLIVGVAFLIWRREEHAIRILFWPALTLKLLGGIALGLIYQEYYHSGDTFYFFDLAKARTDIFSHDPAGYFNLPWREAEGEWKGSARSIFFVNIIAIVNVLTDHNYWITSLWFSFVSFLGSLYLFKSVIRFFPDARPAAALAFLFFPSVVFWSSGVIKESLGLTALLVISGLYLKGMMRQRPGVIEFIFAAFSLWIVWNLKYYWMAVFLPVVVTSLAVHFTSIKLKIPSRWKLLFWWTLFLVLCLSVSLIHPNFYPERLLQVVIENNRAFTAISAPADVIRYDGLDANWASMIWNSPWALVSGLFRPFLWEAQTSLQWFVSVENLLLLALCLSSLTHVKDFIRAQNRLITLSVIVYVLLLCIFLALSTPNLGSLARYKVGFLPFLIFLITYKNRLASAIASLPVIKGLKKWFV